MILLIDNYDSFTYNLYQYVEELGYRCRVVRNDKITLVQIKRLDPTGILLSPGPGTPKDAGICRDVVKELSGQFPIFGVCLGHQTIGEVFGASVVPAPQIIHGKVSQILHKGKGVFQGLKDPIEATRYHSLVVSEKNLPKALQVTATTIDGVIMGIRHKKLPVEGVQFHPESVMTPAGKSLLLNFLKRTSRPEVTH